MKSPFPNYEFPWKYSDSWAPIVLLIKKSIEHKYLDNEKFKDLDASWAILKFSEYKNIINDNSVINKLLLFSGFHFNKEIFLIHNLKFLVFVRNKIITKSIPIVYEIEQSYLTFAAFYGICSLEKDNLIVLDSTDMPKSYLNFVYKTETKVEIRKYCLSNIYKVISTNGFLFEYKTDLKKEKLDVRIHKTMIYRPFLKEEDIVKTWGYVEEEQIS